MGDDDMFDDERVDEVVVVFVANVVRFLESLNICSISWNCCGESPLAVTFVATGGLSLASTLLLLLGGFWTSVAVTPPERVSSLGGFADDADNNGCVDEVPDGPGSDC